VDTSVIIARYMPQDKWHELSERFFTKRDTYYITPLTLVELYSVFSRVFEQISFPSKESFKDRSTALNTLINFVIGDCNLKILSVPYVAEVEIGGNAVRAPIEYVMSFVWASFLGLKSLDLVHISYSWILKVKKGIGTFVTADDEIVTKKETIKKATGVRVRSLKDMV